MKQSAAVLLFAVLVSSVLSGGNREERPGTEPEPWKLAVGGQWTANGRVGQYLVAAWRECSPEHCFTTTYLQRVVASGDDGSFLIVSSMPLKEANEQVGAFVSDITYVFDDPKPHFKLILANTYDSDINRILRVWIEGRDKYRAVFE